jgi:hypothetical protein
VRGEASSFTTAVYVESLRQAIRIASDLYPGSAAGILLPIDPDGLFVAGRRHDGNIGLEGTGEVGEAGGTMRARPAGTRFSPFAPSLR